MKQKKTLILTAAAAIVAFAATQGFAIPFSNASGGPFVATVGAAGDYPTLAAASAAFTGVGGGINAAWTLSILEDTTETAPSYFGQTFGSGASLTISPAASTTPTINITDVAAAPAGMGGHIVFGVIDGGTGSTAGNWDNRRSSNGNYIIDGSNNGSTSRDLKIAMGNSTTSLASAHNRIIRITQNTDGMVIKNLNMEFFDTGGSHACIGFVGGGNSSASVADQYPDDCVIQNCSLLSNGTGANAFGLDAAIFPTVATVGTIGGGHIIEDCDITVRQRGIFFNGMGGFTVRRCNITIANSAVSTSTQAIFPFNSNQTTGYTVNIDSNVITCESASNTAGNGSFGVSIDNGANLFDGTFNVTNNIIKGPFNTAAAPLDAPARAININCTGGSTVLIEHNSIDMPAHASTGASANKVGGIVAPVTSFATGSLTIRNNNIRIGEADGISPAIALASTTNVTSNDNNLFASGASLGAVGATTYANLAAWQGGTTLDAASQSVDPTGTTPAWDANLHFASKPITGLATVASSTVLTDVDGDARPATGAVPGADEPPVITPVTDWFAY